MIKLNSSTFKSIVANESLYINNTVPLIDSKLITEIKVKDKFFYSLQNDSSLYLAQQNLIDKILSKIEINNSSCAFVSKKSYLDFFQPHIGNYNFVRLDIKRFFHSIDIEKLAHMLNYYFEPEHIDGNKKQLLINSFMSLITYTVPSSSENLADRGRVILPIGFKTSPILSNIYMRDFDINIQDYCVKHDIIYTRYADDMLFSSPQESEFIFSDTFTKEASILLSLKNLNINPNKTVKKRHTISLNGYTISHVHLVEGKVVPSPEFRLSNKKTILLKKFLHLIINPKITKREIMEKLFNFDIKKQKFHFKPKRKFIESYCNTLLTNKITGYRSYLISFIKYDSKFNTTSPATIEKYQLILNGLNDFLEKNPSPDFSIKP